MTESEVNMLKYFKLDLNPLAFKCNICSSEFTEKERLEIHKRVHNRKKKKDEAWTPNNDEYVAHSYYTQQKGP
jgi:hypothetical protein